MEYVPGGDLMTLLIKAGRFSEGLARFISFTITFVGNSYQA